MIEVHGSAFLPFDFVADINNANDTFCLFEKLGMTQAVVTNSTRAFCPAPANTLDLTVTFVEISLNNQNVTDDNVPYYYYKPPKLYKIMPRMGPTRGNTTVLAVGSDFKLGKKPLCKFGT
jgi:hypothetical protein